MGAKIRSGSSFLLKLVGVATVLGGLALGSAALLVEADASIQVLMGVIALGGLLIALVGGAFLAIGALVGGGKVTAPQSTLTPEQQQLRDSQEFLAAQNGELQD